jgi:hypothetical protein
MDSVAEVKEQITTINAQMKELEDLRNQEDLLPEEESELGELYRENELKRYVPSRFDRSRLTSMFLICHLDAR